MIQMKIFKINLVRCMGNLSRVLDFASHLEVEQEREREGERREKGRMEERRKGGEC